MNSKTALISLGRRIPSSAQSVRPTNRGQGLTPWGLVVALAIASLPLHAAAESDGQDSPNAPALESAPLTVLGHQRIVQRIVRDESAWTLGDYGEIIAWELRESGWTPIAVRRIDRADGMIRTPEGLIVSSEGETLRVVNPRTLKSLSSASGTSAWRCGNAALWHIERDGRACLYDERDPKRCVGTTTGLPQGASACVVSQDGVCLTLTDEDRSVALCGASNSASVHLSSHPATGDYATQGPSGRRWLSRALGSWLEREEPLPDALQARRRTATCVDTRLVGVAPCTSMDTERALDTTPVRAPRLVEITRDTSGIYFIFADGWLRVQSSLETVESPFVDFQAARLSDYAERIWTPGALMSVDRSGEHVHVQLCEQGDDEWRLLDVALYNAESHEIDRGTGVCPTRVDAWSGEIVYSAGARAMIYNRETQSRREIPLEAPFQGPVVGTLRASARTSRHCGSVAWDVHVVSSSIGTIPVAVDVCAPSITMLRWGGELLGHEGPGILLSSDHSATLHLIDENTLQIVSIHVPQPLSARTQVHLEATGSWLLSDPESPHSLRVSGDLQAAQPTDAIVLLNRVWEHQGGGVYRDGGGMNLLVTDRGVALNNTGFGPVSTRIVRADLRPMDLRPATLRSSLRALVQSR